jgi:hypothetical protein
MWIAQIAVFVEVRLKRAIVKVAIRRMYGLFDQFERAVRPSVVTCRVNHARALARRYAELLSQLRDQLNDG